MSKSQIRFINLNKWYINHILQLHGMFFMLPDLTLFEILLHYNERKIVENVSMSNIYDWLYNWLAKIYKVEI